MSRSPIARKGDHLDHGGQITQGSPNWNCNGSPIARVTDQANCAIHGTVTITTGSPNWSVNGKKMARVGSLCSCGAKIITGSGNWKVT
jgi:uncharacterized Zn-binding protein involved in type VI secretion